MKIPQNNQFTLMIVVAIAGTALALFGYLMWYVSPDEVTERVKVIAITEDGCIVETMDGYPFNIGPCDANQGDIIVATVDVKVKERAWLMNPTN